MIIIYKPTKAELIDMSDEEYFSKKYSDYISNSRLGLIDPERGGSPELYLKGFDNKYVEAFLIGTAVHQTVLQPEEFTFIPEIIRPSGKPGFIADYIIKHNLDYDLWTDLAKAMDETEYFILNRTHEKYQKLRNQIKDYVDAVRSLDKVEDKIILGEFDQMRYKKIVESVKNNIAIQKLLHPVNAKSSNEQAIFVEVPVQVDDVLITLKFKGKFDNYTVRQEDYIRGLPAEFVMNDLKTTSKTPETFLSSFESFSYATQIAIYLWAAKQLYYDPDMVVKANILVVSTKTPFESGVFEIDKDMLKKGLAKAKELLSRVAWHEVYGYDKKFKDGNDE